MATIEMSSKKVAKYAKEMIFIIDKSNATLLNDLLTEEMRKTRWFSKKPKWNSYSEILQYLKHSDNYEYQKCMVSNTLQRERCQVLYNMTPYQDTMKLSHEDMAYLGLV